MDDFCPVCNKKMSLMTRVVIQEGITIHDRCIQVFEKEPEKYVGTVKTEADIEAAEKKVVEEYVELQQKIEEKSVHVKSFDMPFGDMVGFMVKWALASIPAFIILFIIFGILFLIFGSLFF